MKIAVHLHLYYTYMLDEMIGYVSNFGDIKYDLFITIVEENAEVRDKILNFKPDSKIYLVENRGYDVGPFFYFLHQINLDDYDLIWKLQTKRDVDLPTLSSNSANHKTFTYGEKWRKWLFEAILKSKSRVLEIIDDFKNDEKLGMVGCCELISKINIVLEFKNNETHFTHLECKKYANLISNFENNNRIEFVAGTCFVARSSIFNKLKEEYTIYDFDFTVDHARRRKCKKNFDGLDVKSKNDILPYAVEVLLGYAVLLDGFYISTKYKSMSIKDKIFNFILGIVFYRLIRLIRMKKNDKRIFIKVLKIPVFYWRFRKK